MPLYEYECDACGRRFEVIQKFSDAPVDVCRECGKGPVRRLLSSPAIQFKGSGWYITDYSQKGKSDSSQTPGAKTGEGTSTDTTADTKAAKTDKGKTDTAKAETTSATKSKDS